MMRIQTVLLGATFSAALALGSFWLGFREGAELGLLVDAGPRGSVSLYQLETLKRGGLTRNVVTGLEGDVDVALLYADRYEHHPLFPLLEPIWSLPVSSASLSLARLAEYRRTHESPLSAAALAAEPTPLDPEQAAAVREVLRGAESNDIVIRRVVSKYATGSGKP